MPTRVRALRESVKRYGEQLVGVTERHRRETVRILLRIAERLAQAGRELRPEKMGDAEVVFVYETSGGGITNKRYEAQIFRTFLRRRGVVTSQLRAPMPSPERPRISPETFARIHEAALAAGDLRGATVLLLESLTIRRVGVLRLRPEDITPTAIHVLDKGRMGGKPRRIPITPEVWEQLQQYLSWRQRQIMAVLAQNPTHPIPRRLIIWTRRNKMGDAKQGALDLYIAACGRRCGVHLSHHMLRRMACRELWEATDRPEVAMEISGHTDLKTFLTYVGSMDTQKAALVAKMLENREKRRLEAQPANP